MIQPIITDPFFLSLRAEPAGKEDFSLARDLADTLRAHKEGCAGMAANMIGGRKRIIAFFDHGALVVMINPVLLRRSPETYEAEEGCLSLKGLYEHVKRPAHVRVRAQDAEGKEFELDCTGLLAVCVQHEMDHLDGIVFIDHLSMLKKQRACTKLRKLRREEREKEKEKASRR